MPSGLQPPVRAAIELDGHGLSFGRLIPPSYDTPMRAVSLDAAGRPEVRGVDEPNGPGELVRVLACGLCGSDVEKLRPEFAGTVLGHEVVGETADGRRVALVHHRGCGECERCRAGHESTCEQFAAPTIRPGGFAERVRADAWIDVPAGLSDADATALEPLACVVRGADAVPPGRVLVLGQGFVGRLFASVLARRGDEVFALDADPRRTGREAGRACRRGGDLRARSRGDRAGMGCPGGTILVFADAGALPAEADLPARADGRRAALCIAGGDARSGRDPAGARAAGADGASAGTVRRRAPPVPPSRRREGRVRPVKAVRYYGIGDLRVEDVPDPVPGPGDVLVQVEVALTDGTDLKTFRQGIRVLLADVPSGCSGTSSAGSTSPRDGASWRRTRARAARAPRVSEETSRCATACSRFSTAPTRSCSSCRSESRASISSRCRPASRRRSPRSSSRLPAASAASSARE